MLQVLLKNKLRRYLTKNPEDIEDLVTSIVLGSCEYTVNGLSILQFINRARAKDGKRLGELLEGSAIERIDYEFWNRQDFGEPELLLKLKRRNNSRPAWIVLESKVGSGKSSRAWYDPEQFDFDAKDEMGVKDLIGDLQKAPYDCEVSCLTDLNNLLTCSDLRNRLKLKETYIPNSERKFLDWLDNKLVTADHDLKFYLIKNRNRRLLEAIYEQCPRCEERTGDQLAKYWTGMSKRAKNEGADLLALIYVTRSYSFPEWEFQETQQEYEIKEQCEEKQPIALYWRPWYFFAQDILQGGKGIVPKIINDLIELLNQWGWSCDEMKEWPVLHPMSLRDWPFSVEWHYVAILEGLLTDFSFFWIQPTFGNLAESTPWTLSINQEENCMTKLTEEQGRQITIAAQYMGNLLKNINVALQCCRKIIEDSGCSFTLEADKEWGHHPSENLIGKSYTSHVLAWQIDQYGRNKDEQSDIEEILTVGVLLYDPTGRRTIVEPHFIASKCVGNTMHDDIYWIGLVQGFCQDFREGEIYEITAKSTFLTEGKEENEIMSREAFKRVVGNDGKVISIAKPLRGITEISNMESLIKQVTEAEY